MLASKPVMSPVTLAAAAFASIWRATVATMSAVVETVSVLETTLRATDAPASSAVALSAATIA
ncbi:MAG: hypothetical protein KDE24_32275, partial [Caldilinea sp.]|nr:hypothetical protein [Caldilinea sp.]